VVDIDQLKLILNLVREHELSEFEVEQEGLRLKIRKDAAVPQVLPSAPAAQAAHAIAPVVPTNQALEAAAGPEVDLAVIESPIVGTFFSSPEPGAAPFVDVGSVVKRGQVLCIIEAMKLMNEIDSEYDGEVVGVYVENGHPVQYGERLFAIKTG
jgi:acetyl-CoA carboxylase biotin carboxyl carrier protein